MRLLIFLIGFCALGLLASAKEKPLRWSGLLVKRGWQGNEQSCCAGTADYFVLKIANQKELLIKPVSSTQLESLNLLAGKKVEVRGFLLQTVPSFVNPRTQKSMDMTSFQDCQVLEIRKIKQMKR
ncbi:MAG: hypothetical protein EAZ57_09095 [Cytophagales bacterium]|nr:MAG: hypothetical protein EAZ67_09905 [Cytophagales bacterium]TAF60052.1 MAG: hypothetical protein EAZ57_09095 [Cytophagales bacterium]